MRSDGYRSNRYQATTETGVFVVPSLYTYEKTGGYKKPVYMKINSKRFRLHINGAGLLLHQWRYVASLFEDKVMNLFFNIVGFLFLFLTVSMGLVDHAFAVNVAGVFAFVGFGFLLAARVRV